MSDLLYATALIVLALLTLTLGSGMLAVAIHGWFGPDLSPRLQWMADTFMSVYAMGAQTMLGTLRALRGNPGPETPPWSPPAGKDTKQIRND